MVISGKSYLSKSPVFRDLFQSSDLLDQGKRLFHRSRSGSHGLFGRHFLERLVERLGADRTVVTDLQQAAEERLDVDHASGAGQRAGRVGHLVAWHVRWSVAAFRVGRRH